MEKNAVTYFKTMMLLVAPEHLWQPVKDHDAFYQILCERACLPQDLPQVRQAFNELIAEMEQRK